ncbi:MAG TPA: Rpn family recombination-promoting nuclease/putative transposase, partial [Gammaproteobacteria bacterium]|nr:Rpn family recombination-promoting nuclease/putative transposase [Gammaproteobacteria bacterium]
MIREIEEAYHKTESALHNPHDKFFFASLRNHKIAQDALRSFLPEETLKHLDLNNMRLYHNKKITPEMREMQADIFYEIPFDDGKALLLFHCEHLSEPARIIPLKVWVYLLLALLEFAENKPNAPLPLPLPVIVYTGEKKYHYSTDFFDLFGNYQNIVRKNFNQAIQLVDVCRMDDADIRKNQLFGLCEFAFKYKKAKEFDTFCEEAIPLARIIEYEIGSDYVTLFMRYVMSIFEHGDITLFVEQAKRHLSKEAGDAA